MHISRVELENFKSHENSVFEFARGTTSITGENGAGKTSIIEAIAWTIFDTLDYKKEDVVRRGEKKATVRVTFESGLDEREYTVYRDTGTGYYVYDPRLKTRIADKKEEVTRFLWQHLGIEPGTDLESLFKHAIGVPQGTFTAIFLATTGERKRTFDSLLKVEEYRRSSDELLRTVRYIDQQIAAVGIKIALAEGEIKRIDTVEEEQKQVAVQVERSGETLAALNTEAEQKQNEVAGFDQMEVRLSELRSNAEKLNGSVVRADLVLRQLETDLERSRAAVKRVEETKGDAEIHRNGAGRLKELERERVERQKLLDELGKTETALAAVRTERKHLEEELERIQNAHSEIARLSISITDQERLENDVHAKRAELARAESAADQLKAADERIEELRAAYRNASDDLTAAREKIAGAERLEGLLKRDSVIVRELAAANAALERDERFQKEIKNGLCPILSQKCLNLKEGETLEGFISSQFGELRSRIETLSAEELEVGEAVKAARGAERFAAQIPVLETRVKEIGDEGLRLKSQKDKLESEAGKLPGLKEEFARIDLELKALDNPKARVSVLQKNIVREPEIREMISSTGKNLERLESSRRLTVEQLEVYKDLDSMLAEAADLRDRTAEAYRIFVVNEGPAGQAAEFQTAFDSAKAEYAKAVELASAADKAADDAGKGYDRDTHQTARSALVDLQKRLAESGVILESAKTRQRELTAEIERLYTVRESMQDEFRERERLQKVAETTDFIRSTLKEAAPLVAKNYVHHVSLEANQMFREVGGNAELTLRWGEDYAIYLEEGGYDRPFQSLSGGEQMAAALSVRLALLKQLSDIRIAFFDEPTTNMDAERRENLAMQISQISHFEQLFVISHDDTFEGYMDHEVRVEKV